MKPRLLRQSFLLSVFMAISVLSICFFSSCSKEKANDSDNYYVKYVIIGNGAYGRFSDWTFTTPNGQYSNSGSQVRSWTQTYGPVKRNFKCEVQIGTYIGGAPIIEIHVSKNEEPFALKVTNTGASAVYTINY